MRRLHLIVFIFGIFALVSSLGYFAYTAWGVYMSAHRGGASPELTAAQIAHNKDVLTDAFVNVGLSYLDVTRGFWTRYVDAYGVEQVMFLDVNDLARRGLTDWQIQQLLARVQASALESKDSMRMTPEEELPTKYQFHNKLYGATRGSQDFNAIGQSLEAQVASDAYTADTLFELGYLYELTAQYAKRDALYAQACAEFGEQCTRDIPVTVRGRVVDGTQVPIQNVAISVVGVSGEVPVITNEKGEYSFTITTHDMEKLRIRASKRNYSDGFLSLLVVTEGRDVYQVEDIVLATPLTVVHVNNDTHAIVGGLGTTTPDGKNLVTSSALVTYYIPWDAFVKKDGSMYRGDIDITMYEFSKANAPDSLLVADVLTPELGYSGDVMVTFGMPYIQFFTPSGEEVHIRKSNPMRLVQKMASIDMERLRSNSDGQAERGLTDKDLKQLVDASFLGNFPLTYEYLARHGLDHFPAYWVFDRTAGVWDNIGMNVLDMDGTVETHFYTINDER